jgi:hypothetical protein
MVGPRPSRPPDIVGSHSRFQRTHHSILCASSPGSRVAQQHPRFRRHCVNGCLRNTQLENHVRDVWCGGNGGLPPHGVQSPCSWRARGVHDCLGGRSGRGACRCGGGHRRWWRLRASAHPRSLGSRAHACNVSWAHRTIFLDTDAATRCAAAGPRHGGRAGRPLELATPAGRGAAVWAAVSLRPPPTLATPEGSPGAQTTTAWCRGGLGAARPHEALTEAREIRRATPHPSMAH